MTVCAALFPPRVASQVREACESMGYLVNTGSRSRPGCYEAPRYVAALIADIASEVERVERALTGEICDALRAAGAAYVTACFALRASPARNHLDRRPANFEARTPDGGWIRVWWGQQLGHDMVVDRLLTPEHWMAVYDICMAELDHRDTRDGPRADGPPLGR